MGSRDRDWHPDPAGMLRREAKCGEITPSENSTLRENLSVEKSILTPKNKPRFVTMGLRKRELDNANLDKICVLIHIIILGRLWINYSVV